MMIKEHREPAENKTSTSARTKIDFDVDSAKVFGLMGDSVTTTAGRTR